MCSSFDETGEQNLTDLGSVVFNAMLMRVIQFLSRLGSTFNGLIAIHGCDWKLVERWHSVQ